MKRSRPQRAAAVKSRDMWRADMDTEESAEDEEDDQGAGPGLAAEGVCNGDEGEKEGGEGSAKAPTNSVKALKAPQAPQAPKAPKAPPAALEVRSPVHGLPESMPTPQTVLDGLRVGAAVALRAHISRSGTVLQNGSSPAITPLPRAVPAAVVLTRTGVAPLLTRAAVAAWGSSSPGGRDMAAAIEHVLAALHASPAAAAEDGTTPLFNVTGHRPLARLLAKHGVSSIPGEVILTGGGIRITFRTVRFVRRLERVGDQVTPGRLFNWSPKGNSWLRPAPAHGRNGAGLRTLSRSWKDWVCGVAGAYDPEGVMEGWQPDWDGAKVVVADPGLLLPLCLSDGRALPKALWHRLRRTWADFVPKPKHVRRAEVAMGQAGGQARHAGSLTFLRYVAAFHAAEPDLTAYYGSAKKNGAREYKLDKQRSLLDQLLQELAPSPQARALPCTQCTGGID